jgi:hypothetical protein
MAVYSDLLATLLFESSLTFGTQQRYERVGDDLTNL